MATHQRSRTAILAGAKLVIAKVGSYESNMLEIAEHAQVARATVYNHFSDKEEMMLTLVESEILRLSSLAEKAHSKSDALYILSREIATDPALHRMVQTDPLDIAKFVTRNDHPLWNLATSSLTKIFGSTASDLVLHWLIGQIASPLTQEQSKSQAELLALAIT